MQYDLPAPAVRLLRSEACVFMPAFAQELVWTIRQIAPGERRDGINHLAKLALVRLQRLFSSFAIIDVSKQQIPGSYPIVCIAHGEAANLEPSVHAISPP